MSILRGLIGLGSLLFGRSLFWLFVGAAGFAVAASLAASYFEDQAAWLILLVALLSGVLGSVLAVLAQELAVALGGFFAGGYLFRFLGGLLVGGDLPFPVLVAIFILGGILGAIFAVWLFDVALIVLSSFLGASLIVQSVVATLDLTPAARGLVFLLLVIIGVGVQWTLWQRVETDEVEERAKSA